MTIASTLSKKQYEGNGLTTEFPLPFAAADKAHIFAVVKKGLEVSMLQAIMMWIYPEKYSFIL